MNKTESLEWIDYHVDVFAIRKKLFDCPQATLDAWCECVEPISLENAKAASRKMFAEPDLKPYKWQDHPGKIRQIANDISHRHQPTTDTPRMIDGEIVYDCSICQDIGALTVWQDQSILAMQRGEFGDENSRSWAVACTCRMGDGHAKRIRRYDARRDVKCLTTYDTASIEALKERYEDTVPHATEWHFVD